MRTKIFSLAVVSVSFLATPPPLALDARPASAVQPDAGELVWRNGTLTLRLIEQPCRITELADALELSEGMPQAPQAAVVAQVGRGSISACWVADVNGDVVMRDAAGTEGFIPMDWFQRDAAVSGR
jgi:hypothetical protein